MHSFVLLLTLVSSAFAAPLQNSVVNAPAKVIAPVKAAAGVAAKVYAPIKAAVGNVNVHDVNAANGAVTHNNVIARDVTNSVANVPVGVKAPIDAVVGVVADVTAPIKAAIANADIYDVNVANGAASGNKVVIKRDNKVVNAPVDAFAPVDALVGVAAKVVAPVDAAVANADIYDVNVLQGAASKNNIIARDVTNTVANPPIDVKAPIDALVGVAAKVVAPIDAAIGNIDASDINVANGALSGNSIVIKRANNVVDAPVGVFAPVNAVAGVAAKVAAPVNAAVANADIYDVNVANGAVTHNNVIAKRDVVNAPVHADTPVDAVAGVAAKVIAPIDADVANACIDDVNVANGALSGNNIAL